MKCVCTEGAIDAANYLLRNPSAGAVDLSASAEAAAIGEAATAEVVVARLCSKIKDCAYASAFKKPN